MQRWLTVAQSAVLAAMFIGSAAVWPAAPERILVHWSLRGQPDPGGYSGKVVGLFAMPLLTLALLGLLKLLPRVDPNRARYAEFPMAYAIVTLAVVAFMGGVHGMILASAVGARLNAGLVIALLVGALLIVVGAVMDRFRRNWFVGIRTPWTLSSERSWNATHRAGRFVFIAMGVAVALAGLMQTAWAFYVTMLICVVGIIGLVAYSFVVGSE